jgi:hypothetical protein
MGHRLNRENDMRFIVRFSKGAVIPGIYEAADEQGARDACARDAGYQSEADMVEQIEQPSEMVAKECDLSAIPGHARQVYNGWIWVTPGEVEHAWSRGRTREECENEVIKVTESIGVEGAFAE